MHGRKKPRTAAPAAAPAAGAQQPMMMPMMMPQHMGMPMLMQQQPQQLQQRPMMPMMMMPQPGQAGMQQWPQPQQQQQMVQQPAVETEAAEADEDDDDEDSEESGDASSKYDTGPQGKITRSACALQGVPKIRLSELVETINPDFDSAVTAEFDQITLAMLIWIFTRIKPKTKVSDLRVHTYSKLGALMVASNKRLIANLTPTKYQDTIVAVLGHMPTQQGIKNLAASLGFSEEMLAVKRQNSQKGGGKGSVQTALSQAFAASASAAAAAGPDAASSAAAPQQVAPQQVAPPQRAGVNAAAAAAQAAGGAGSAGTAAAEQAAASAAPTAQAATGAEVFQQMLGSMNHVAMEALLQTMQQRMQQTAPGQRQQTAAGLVPNEGEQQQQQQQQPVAPQPGTQQAQPELAAEQTRAFCRSDLGSDGLEALLCGHVFHTSCIEDYMSATGKSRQQACPYKCAQSDEFAVAEDRLNHEQDRAAEPLPVVIDEEGDRLAQEALAAAGDSQ